MKKLLLILILFTTTLASGQLIKQDKIVHTVVGAGISATVNVAALATIKRVFPSISDKVAGQVAFWLGFAAAAYIGHRWEVKGKLSGATYDFEDLGHTAGGGFLMSAGIKFSLKSKKKYLFDFDK